MSERAGRLSYLLGLLVIVVLGTAARLWQAGESLWLDELHTSWVVSGTLDELGSRARMGNQSPLYFYLVRLSVFVLGENELATRMPSLVAGVGLIIAAGVFTWRWCGLRSAGWLAAALVAMDHNMIFFAQEARPYAVAQLVALLQLAAFWRLQAKHDWGTRAVVVGGWILLFHLHYTAILLVAGELLWWAAIQIWQRGRGGYRPAQVVCDLVLTAVACAVAWRHLADIATRRAMWQMFISQKPPWAALRWFHWDRYVLSTLVLCVILTSIAYFMCRKRDQRRLAVDSPNWLAVAPLLVAWWTVPVLIAWSLTASDLARVFFPRYLIGVAVAPMICGGLCLGICRGPRTRAVAMLAIMAWALYGNGLASQYWRDGRLITDRRQDWHGAVAWLNAVREDSAPVLVRSGLIEADRLRLDFGDQASRDQLRQYCNFPVTGLYAIDRPGVILPLPTPNSGQLSSEAIRLLEQHRGGWLVINARRAAHKHLRRKLHASFPGDRLRFVRAKSFGNVAVWQVTIAK